MAEIIFSQGEKINPHYEQIKFGIRTAIKEQGGTFAETIEIQAKEFDFGNQLVMALSARVFCENVDQFRMPIDWWQAFKERWFPKIILKKWPVKYKRIDVKAYYPRLQVPYKDPYKDFKGNKPIFHLTEKEITK